jgi:hypothetical protein
MIKLFIVLGQEAKYRFHATAIMLSHIPLPTPNKKLKENLQTF